MNTLHLGATLALCTAILSTAPAAPPPLTSIDTGYTISRVRTAKGKDGTYIIAGTYEGTLLGMTYSGTARWQQSLSGFMNRDLCCADLTGDGVDEILAANADGNVYCLDDQGTVRWQFKANDAPMNAVCVVHRDEIPYVVCGGYDTRIYYLSAEGQQIKAIPSSKYSVERVWGKDPSKPPPPQHLHTANFLRTIRQPDGRDVLMLHGVNHAMSTQGSVYLFNPLEDKPFRTIKLSEGKTFGDVCIRDVDRDGKEDILLGVSSMIQDAGVVLLDIDTTEQTLFKPSLLRRKVDGFGYRVAQPETIMDAGKDRLFVLFGSRIFLVPPDMNPGRTEVLTCSYSFNDMWKDETRNLILLASSQSGGSCIHLLDLNHAEWKRAYAELEPPGNIADILQHTATAREQLQHFVPPAWEREPLPVYLMAESTRSVTDLVDQLKQAYESPVFLNGVRLDKEHWDRSGLANEKYRNRRDRRMKYTLTQDQVLQKILPHYEGAPGIAYWGGHGNDPYMFHPDTTRKVIDGARGKKTVLIYPELEDHSDDFTFCLEDLLYPLAEHSQGKNANLYIRTKHAFWQGSIYRPVWSRLVSGEFADVFVPSMEETSDKSMEQSVAGRLGMWTSGAVNQWGTRCARDNPSFDRLRQHSHQMLPNHFLRTMVYHISSGARYINNFPVDQQYMSFLWELIATGALYVPKRSEIVSFSPVHLSMKEPDEHYMHIGSNVKWTTFFDQRVEDENPMVFSRLNGSWPGAPVTEWDFSRYAAGVAERRLNFLPPYPNGLVLITPPQHGVFAARNPPRGALTDHLHPLYKKILREYITDGRQYLSSDGTTTYAADDYYKTIEADIQQQAQLLPLTVSGDVAWVAAQSSPTHLRLTLIDSGYLNPKPRTARVRFQTVQPVKMTDVLDLTVFDLKHPSSVDVKVPRGLFRFIDIELSKPGG